MTQDPLQGATRSGVVDDLREGFHRLAELGGREDLIAVKLDERKRGGARGRRRWRRVCRCRETEEEEAETGGEEGCREVEGAGSGGARGRIIATTV